MIIHINVFQKFSSVSGLKVKLEELTARLVFSPQQIRKLRRELEASQDKVANLTNQLSANVCTEVPNTSSAAHMQQFSEPAAF